MDFYIASFCDVAGILFEGKLNLQGLIHSGLNNVIHVSLSPLYYGREKVILELCIFAGFPREASAAHCSRLPSYTHIYSQRLEKIETLPPASTELINPYSKTAYFYNQRQANYYSLKTDLGLGTWLRGRVLCLRYTRSRV